jgi:hypothetical protein
VFAEHCGRLSIIKSSGQSSPPAARCAGKTIRARHRRPRWTTGSGVHNGGSVCGRRGRAVASGRDGNAGQRGLLPAVPGLRRAGTASRLPVSLLAWHGPAASRGSHLAPPRFQVRSSGTSHSGFTDVRTGRKRHADSLDQPRGGRGCALSCPDGGARWRWPPRRPAPASALRTAAAGRPRLRRPPARAPALTASGACRPQQGPRRSAPIPSASAARSRPRRAPAPAPPASARSAARRRTPGEGTDQRLLTSPPASIAPARPGPGALARTVCRRCPAGVR